jgi:hypothetical protein
LTDDDALLSNTGFGFGFTGDEGLARADGSGCVAGELLAGDDVRLMGAGPSEWLIVLHGGTAGMGQTVKSLKHGPHKGVHVFRATSLSQSAIPYAKIDAAIFVWMLSLFLFPLKIPPTYDASWPPAEGDVGAGLVLGTCSAIHSSMSLFSASAFLLSRFSLSLADWCWSSLLAEFFRDSDCCAGGQPRAFLKKNIILTNETSRITRKTMV